MHPEYLYSRGARLQAKYVTRWAARFLSLDDVVVTDIPVGKAASLSRDGRFELAIDRLWQDPADGELQIWASDQTTGAPLAQLISTRPKAVKARMGGLKLREDYPSEIVFGQCEVNSTSPYAHDRFERRLRAIGASGLNSGLNSG